MLLLRAVLLEILVCFHVIGAAVLFRRLFPRESSWMAFIVPTLSVMAVFNFLEHFISMPNLGWLLPFTFCGLLWGMLQPGYAWDGWRLQVIPNARPGFWGKGLLLPGILFLSIFTWAFYLKCLYPEITCNTEGVADMARVVDFCLGGKLPAMDSWMPPYDHGGYYSFQHYGASLLKRLFSLDVGTGYNMGFTLLNTMTCLVGVGAAYHMSGKRTWVALAVMLVLLANFTGSSFILLFLNTFHPDPNLNTFDSRLAIDIGDDWNNPARHNPFGWIYHVPPPVLRLFTPTFNTYFAEFHANLGGHFMTLATMLAANEAFKTERSNWPWICLIVFPLITVLMATWFMIVVTVLCLGGLAVALIAGRRPANGKWVLIGGGLAIMFLWPSVDSLISGSYPVNFHLTPWNEYTPFWVWVIQWWPVYIPWFFLCFVWRRLNLLARWIHLAVPLLLIFIDVCTFQDRGLTVEKMWGAVYGVGLVTFLPLVFVQKNRAFKFLTIVILFISTIMFAAWIRISTQTVYWDTIAFHLKGDTVFENDPQKKRMLQVLKRLHGATVLSGKSVWSYNQAPSMVGFSENRCFIAWFAQEYQCGHGGEAEYRNQVSNQFYAGTLQNPLAFLRANDIAAVLIYPDEDPTQCIPDNILAQLQAQIGAEYYYIDCKPGGAQNAGVFLRLPAAP